MRGLRQRGSSSGAYPDQRNAKKRTVLRERDGQGPSRRLGISRFDEGQHGWEEARNARLSWHFTVRPQPSLEPTAGQCTRTAGYVRESHVQGWRTKETVGSETLQAPPSGLHHVPPPRAVPLQRVMNALQGGVPLSPPADKRLTRRRVRGVLALPELHQHLPATPELHGPARRMNLPKQD